ncbi:TetR/AcrR family transcriptional regulator [Nocardia sp. BMG111209]|uniref:TetR/AcrR family transcriptional regulator n=1 Tax=Nocardia sp. BMG111209 TaxID=1160137 RepID=UPI00035DFC1C|nr:TetR/AcrR family transcriptional regulator [Nocardia sp. BMG111209]
MNAPHDARKRSAETKRLRTRAALVAAARAHFAARGWQATRVEDIAHEAGVSVATAFNHFSKQTLLGHVYAPLFEPMLTAARSDIDTGTDPVEALERHIRALTAVCRRHQTLTVALLAAVQEQTIAAAGAAAEADDGDVRNIVPFPRPLAELIDYGQRAGRFRPEPASADVAVYHINALMLRIMTRPGESADATAELVLGQLLPPLLIASG